MTPLYADGGPRFVPRRDAGRKGMNALKGLSMVKKLMSTKSMKPGDESGDAKEGEDEEDADTTDINEQENRIK